MMHHVKRKLPGFLRSPKNQALNYDHYRPGVRGWGLIILRTVALLSAVGFLFYNSPAVFLLFIPLLAVMYVREKHSFVTRRRQRLAEQFKDAITLLYSFVSTGSTLEQAFCRSADELRRSWRAEDDIVREFEGIRRKLDMNVTIEACMEDFARRSRLEDIESFSQVVSIAKRGGGSMSGVIKNSVETIRAKMECENEIRTLIHAKSSEFRLMVMVPLAVLLYMRLFSPGFMDVLYGNIVGGAFMSVCLGVYTGAVLWGMKILDIRV